MTPYSAYSRSYQRTAEAAEHALEDEGVFDRRAAKPFSLAKTADIDLARVLELRKTEGFRSVREGLRLYRKGAPNVCFPELLGALERCSRYLFDYGDYRERERDEIMQQERHREEEGVVRWMETSLQRVWSISFGGFLQFVFKIVGKSYCSPMHQFKNTAWLTRSLAGEDLPVQYEAVHGIVQEDQTSGSPEEDAQSFADSSWAGIGKIGIGVESWQLTIRGRGAAY